jgi:hypothetical protein
VAGLLIHKQRNAHLLVVGGEWCEVKQADCEGNGWFCAGHASCPFLHLKLLTLQRDRIHKQQSNVTLILE